MIKKQFLIKRGFSNLINATKVESYRYFNFPSILPNNVLLAITYKCNSRCRMCNIWKKYENNFNSLKNEIALDDFITFVKKNNFLTKISITGGELFLRNDLHDIIIFLDKMGYNTDLVTNGILLNKIKKEESKILRNLSGDKPHILSISIDGFEKTNDYLRGIVGLFKKNMKLLKWCINQKNKYDFFDVSISYTITEKNYKELNFFIDHFVNLGLRPEQISFRVAQESFYFNNIKKREKINIHNFLNEFQKIQKKYPVFKNDFFYKKIPQFLLNPKKLVIPCAATFSFCYINPYWDVYPCIQWDRKLGNLKKYKFDLKTFWKSRTINETRKLISNDKCPNCWTQCSAIPSINAHIPSFMQRYWNSIKYIDF